VNPLGLSSEGNDPSTWGTGVKMAIHRFIAECVSEKIVKSVNIWQSYKQERYCLMHFVRLANTQLNDGESARNNHILASNFAKYSPI